MTLLEHPDIYALISAFGPVIIGGVIGVTFVWQRHKQSKLDSARLTLELLAKLRTKEFRKCQDRVIFQESLEGSEELLAMRIRYLDHFNTICGLYYHDNVLKKHHVSENFGAMLHRISKHQETIKYLYGDMRKSSYQPVKRWLEEETNVSLP